MELLLEKPVIIEFNGLPATGKSTIANELISILHNRRINCVRSYVKHKWQTNGYTVFLSLKLVKLHLLLNRFAKSIIPRKGRTTHIMGEMYHFRSCYDFLRSKGAPKVLVVDQGLIQSIVSIAHLDKIEEVESLRQVLNYYREKGIAFICINCAVNPQLSCERIHNRQDNTARMHKVSESELLSAMKMQAANIILVRKIFAEELPIDVIEVDTSLTPSENANFILNKLIIDGFVTKKH